jgi:hypothetical protein
MSKCNTVYVHAIMVAKQLHKLSKVPRTLGVETEPCRPSAGIVQLGLTNVEASVDAAASRSMQNSMSVIVASMLVLSDRSHRELRHRYHDRGGNGNYQDTWQS